MDYTETEEELLLALDQLAQTVEVMGAVINRLKRQVEEQAAGRRAAAAEANGTAAGVVRLH